MHNGLLSGGGIGDYVSYELGYQPFQSGTDWFNDGSYAHRTVFDLLFFIVVLVLLLNIIFGIVLDTFATMREEANERQALVDGQCFICGNTKVEFDDAASKLGNQEVRAISRSPPTPLATAIATPYTLQI